MPKTATKQGADVVARIDAQIQGVIAEIDAQIGQLEEKKTALLNLFSGDGGRRRGRPAGSKKAVVSKVSASKKRVVSEETRKLLGEKKRQYWAKVRAEKAKAKNSGAK